MKSSGYYIIQGWMINELKLKGNDLTCFAVVYSFSQDGESEFTGSLKYLQSCMNAASKNTVISALDALMSLGYILKTSVAVNQVTFCKYKYNEPVVQKLVGGLPNNALGGGSNFGINNPILDNTVKSNNINKEDFALFYKNLTKKEKKEMHDLMAMKFTDPTRVLFSDSKWASYDELSGHLRNDSKFVAEFRGVDLRYYIDKADAWSENGNEGKGVFRTDRGWYKTLRDWMTEAKRKGTLEMLPTKPDDGHKNI